MSDSRKIIMVAGFGLLAFLLMKQMKGQPRQILATRPVQTGNRNPLFNLALPNISFGSGNFGTSGATSFPSFDFGMFGDLSSGNAQMLNPNVMSVDPAIFDVAGGMSTPNGYFVPTGLGAETALW